MPNEAAFSGKLSFLNLGELLQLLGTNGASGVLRLSSEMAPVPGVIFFEKGNPIHAENGGNTGLHAIYSLFGWLSGTFAFTQEPVTCEKSINKARMEIILDGLRMLDEGKIDKLGGRPDPSPGAPAGANGESLDGNKASVSLKDSKNGKLPVITGPLVDYSYVVDEEGFYDGDEIVQEGNHGDWIWVILEGTAEIVKKTPQGPVKIIGISDGSFLGSLAALLAGNNVRSASAFAAGNIQLGMLDTQLITSELAAGSTNLKNLIKSLDNRLRGVTARAVEAFAGNGRAADLLEGKRPVIKQGQKEKRLFRILEGSATVVQTIEGEKVPLAILKPGDIFGSIPFLNLGHEPHSAAIFATGNMKINTVDADALAREYERLTPMLRNLIEHQATCVSVTSLVVRNYMR